MASLSVLVKPSLSQPSVLLSCFATAACWSLTWNLFSTKSPSHRYSSQLGRPHPVLIPWLMFSQVQDIDLVLVELHRVLVSPFLQPVQVFLREGSPFQSVNFPSQFGIIGKLCQGTFDPIFQIIYGDIGPNTDHWETPLVTCWQFEMKQFTATLHALSISQFPTHGTNYLARL